MLLLDHLSSNTFSPKELEKLGIVLSSHLGSGNYGDVWKGEYSGKNVAVKVPKKITNEFEIEMTVLR